MANSNIEQFLASAECRTWLDGCARKLGANSFETVFSIGLAMADERRDSKEPNDHVRGMFNELRDALIGWTARCAAAATPEVEV